MWQITAKDIFRFRGAGGDRFVEFCDNLISIELQFLGIPFSVLHTMLKTTVPDGGVDTKIDGGSHKDVTGWLGEKTIWQYKATASNPSEAELVGEINKRFSTECIQSGYAYRFCICDSITAEKSKQWEDILNKEAKKINASASLVKIVNAEHLARWASKYPAIILDFFEDELKSLVFPLKTQLITSREVTRHYIQNLDWKPIQEEIKRHVDFSIQRPDPVLSIQGKAGVGKTRMVLETVAAEDGLVGITIYSNDDKEIEKVVKNLINRDKVAIIIVDECSLESSVKISDMIQAHSGKIRVIAIDNQSNDLRGIEPRFSLEKIPDKLISEILEKNFPAVSEDRRTLYVHLSKGFVRFAADLCKNDDLLTRTGSISVPSRIFDYYQSRFRNKEDKKVIEALSLFSTVGFKDDVADQLEFICEISQISRSEFELIANRLHDSPGFVGRGGRFFYITPDILAKLAFEKAWSNWIQNNPNKFFSLIPTSMIRLFARRVSEYGTENHREQFRTFFQSYLENITSSDLADKSEMGKIDATVQTNPHLFLPILRTKIESATEIELKSSEGKWQGKGWGARRILVWLLERLMAFKEFFFDSEICLLKLAIAETEPEIRNNSTEIWKELFRIYLSGTELNFFDRLKLLKKRLSSDSNAILELAMGALSDIFNMHISKMLGPPIVAGRLAPNSWIPKTNEEANQCLSEALNLLVECSQKNNLHDKAQDIGIKYCRYLLGNKKLKELKLIFENLPNEKFFLELDEAISDTIHYDVHDLQEKFGSEYVNEILEWQSSLMPNDFHGSLVHLVGKNLWDRSLRNEEEEWNRSLEEMADELVKNPALFNQEIEWLCSSDAITSGNLGQKIGKIDKEEKFLDIIWHGCLKSGISSFARGYIDGLMEINPKCIPMLNEYLDKIIDEKPVFAFELSFIGGEKLNALKRTLSLIDFGKLDIRFLRKFAYGSAFTELTSTSIKEIFERCNKCGVGVNQDAFDVGEAFLAGKIKTISPNEKVLDVDQNLLPIILSFLENESTHAEASSHVGYWWGRTVEALINSNPEEIIRIAFQSLKSKNHLIRESSEGALASIAHKNPSLILEKLESFLLAEESDDHFMVRNFSGIFAAISSEEIKKWLEKNGVKAVRKIARYLQPPKLDLSDSIEVPLLTAYVLEKFENDQIVFDEFMKDRFHSTVMSGDIAAVYEKRAEAAGKYFGHPLKRIREWATLEHSVAKRLAEYWRQYMEEVEIRND